MNRDRAPLRRLCLLAECRQDVAGHKCLEALLVKFAVLRSQCGYAEEHTHLHELGEAVRASRVHPRDTRTTVISRSRHWTAKQTHIMTDVSITTSPPTFVKNWPTDTALVKTAVPFGHSTVISYLSSCRGNDVRIAEPGRPAFCTFSSREIVGDDGLVQWLQDGKSPRSGPAKQPSAVSRAQQRARRNGLPDANHAAAC